MSTQMTFQPISTSEDPPTDMKVRSGDHLSEEKTQIQGVSGNFF